MPTTTRRDETQIRALIDERAEALRRKNADGVVADQSADFVQYSLAPPLISADADVKGLKAWFDTWNGPLGYELHDLEVSASDTLAFAYGLVRLSGDKIGSGKASLWFRATLCFEKVDGAWKVIHEHESVPFYMDGSFRAATDLKP